MIAVLELAARMLRLRFDARSLRGAALRHRLDPVTHSSERAVGDAARLARAARTAARLLPGTRCLAAAAALCDALRRRGHGARLRIGVGRDRSGFAAHAWVEIGANRCEPVAGQGASLVPLESAPVEP
jgi:hypothetical protein